MTSEYSMRLLSVLEETVKPRFGLYWPEFINKYDDPEKPEKMRFALQEYAQQLIAHRITKTMLEAGMRKAQTLKFRPNPYEFAQLCLPTPKELGLPTEVEVFEEVVKRRGPFKGREFVFSHRLVEIIDERVGYRMYREREDAFRELVAGEYAYWLDRAMRDDLPEYRAALAHVQPKEQRPVAEIIGYKAKPSNPIVQRMQEVLAQRGNKGVA